MQFHADVIASYISESNLPCDVIDPPPPECNDADSGTFDFLEVLEDVCITVYDKRELCRPK